ncbi:MAG: dCTP deaminase [archaeon]
MPILSDKDIRLRLQSDLKIEPLLDEAEQIGPVSVDLRLGFSFRYFKPSHEVIIDPMLVSEKAKYFRMAGGDVKHTVYEFSDEYEGKRNFILHENDYVLVSTLETISMPGDLIGHLNGRISLAKIGLLVNPINSIVEPGFKGQLTLCIQNIAKNAVKLYPGMRIASISFETISSLPEKTQEKRPSKYFKEKGVGVSKISEDVEFSQKKILNLLDFIK